MVLSTIQINLRSLFLSKIASSIQPLTENDIESLFLWLDKIQGKNISDPAS